MTREEAIGHIKDVICENNTIKPNMVVFEQEKEALCIAIKALEHPERNVVAVVPCGDTISRQAVLDALRTCYDTHIIERENGSEYIDYEMAVNEVGQLPLVTPKPMECEDAVSRKAVHVLLHELEEALVYEKNYISRERDTTTIIEDILALPPVTPKQRLCKDCKWWKDSDGIYRRDTKTKSQCPIHHKEVFEGNGYCFLFEPKEGEIE